MNRNSAARRFRGTHRRSDRAARHACDSRTCTTARADYTGSADTRSGTCCSRRGSRGRERLSDLRAS